MNALQHRPGQQRGQPRVPLRDIARDTGGRYFNAPDADQLQAIYSGLATRFATVRVKQEMTAAFAGGALVLLIGGLAFSLVRGGRLP